MPVRRRLTLLAATAALVAAPAATAFAQGAGDSQYADPFGDSGKTTSTKRATTPKRATSTTTTPSLSPTPEPATTTPAATTTSPAAAPAATTSTAPAPAKAAARQLPSTGADLRLVVAAGAVLLLGGAGLRLRLDGRR